MRFAAGETLRLIVAGADIYRKEEGVMLPFPMHEQTRNRGVHIIRTGGAFDLIGAHHVAAAEVAGFVGDDAEKLVGRVGFHDGAGIDADAQTQRGESIQVVAGDQQVMYAVGVKTGGFQDGPRLGFQETLNLGIADNALCGLSLGDDWQKGDAGHQAGRDDDPCRLSSQRMKSLHSQDPV